MSDIAIKAENLSKRYRLGSREGYRTFRETLVDAAKAPLEQLARLFRTDKRFTLRGQKSSKDNTIWALKDVSFEIKQGEVIGIIGRNGAGKSTLLKILSKITEPTEGRVELRGRIGSLLEVGTGFHPELTGHENIYLYGAILGMDRWEISRKFDEIVSFAELEKFINTPVKRYSSGMYMRLAFAVAAHLEPEILLVDEVLAVGDALFQKKCLGKMGDVSKKGRTVLLVSHQMNAIRKLCDICIWLDAGQIKMIGSREKTISAYETALSASTTQSPDREEDAYLPARFLSWEIIDPEPEAKNMLTQDGRFTFKVLVRAKRNISNGQHGIALWNEDGQLMWAWEENRIEIPAGLSELVYELPMLPLRPGIYHWQVSLYEDAELLDNWHCVPEFVIATEPFGHHLDQWQGLLNITCDFKINPV
ncbi:polysaccharide ABC transporter ATP-binding protein [Thermodesulfobacteriota bacterium]